MRQLPTAPPVDLPIEPWWTVCATPIALTLATDILSEKPLRPKAGSRRMQLLKPGPICGDGSTAWLTSSGAAAFVGGAQLDAGTAAEGEDVAKDSTGDEDSGGISKLHGSTMAADGDMHGFDDGGGAESGSADGWLSSVAREALVALSAVPFGRRPVSSLPSDGIRELYCEGLVRLEVPIAPFDKVAIPPLVGFVMNRVAHDPMERLLYQIFVSNDEMAEV